MSISFWTDLHRCDPKGQFLTKSKMLRGGNVVNKFRSSRFDFWWCFKHEMTFKNISENSKFENIGNDAIDGSGSSIIIEKNIFSNVEDKAISAGENSNFEIINSYFDSNELALVSKDGSKVISTSNIFYNNKLDFASFVKKKFYGPSETIFNNAKIKSFLIEEKSIVEGLDSISYSYDVESKLYGNLYGRASE